MIEQQLADIKRVSRGELTAGEIVDVVDAGGRVIIELTILGQPTKLAIRSHDGSYYCDTPMKLFKHDTVQGLRACLEKFRLTSQEMSGEPELARVSA